MLVKRSNASKSTCKDKTCVLARGLDKTVRVHENLCLNKQTVGAAYHSMLNFCFGVLKSPKSFRQEGKEADTTTL